MNAGVWLSAVWRRLRQRRVPELEPAEAYRRWAAGYDRQDNELQLLEAEARARLLPDLTGRRVLDAGCGKGRASIPALQRGAETCVGADLTLAMLLGDGRVEHPAVRLLVARVERLPLDGEAFDAVIAALVLGHVADLGAAVAELARVLVPGGHLVITSFHPAAARRGWLRTFQDPARGRTYSIRQHPHRVADYRNALAAAGLTLEELIEPRWQGRRVVLALRARKAQNPI